MLRALSVPLVWVLLLELAVRALGLLDRYTPYPPALLVRAERSDLGYALRPGAQVSSHFHDVRVNELGLRGPELEPRGQPARERILLLGDSVVFGHLLDEGSTLSVLLARRLEEVGRDAEVLNGGVPGYDTPAEAAWLESVGLASDPDHAVLCISLNDFDPAPVIGRQGHLISAEAEARSGWLERHSALYLLVRGLWSRRHDLTSAQAALDRLVAREHKQFYRELPPLRWQRTLAGLDRIASLARARGIPLSLVVFPERDQLESASPDLHGQAAWSRAAAERRLPLLDLRPAFAADGRGPALFEDVQHPNADGVGVAVRAIADWLPPSERVGALRDDDRKNPWNPEG